MLKKIVFILLAWKIAILVLSLFATYILPFKPTFTPLFQGQATNLSYFIDIWGNFDGYHYMRIASQGYDAARLPFFPLYPLLLRVVHTITSLPYLLSGILISTIFFFGEIYFIYKLTEIDKKQNYFLLILIIMLLFPTSYSYGAVYNDSLFLFLASGCIYYGRKSAWYMATLFGMLATLTRLNGLALAFFLFFEYLLQKEIIKQDDWKLDIQRNLKKLPTVKDIFFSGAWTIIFVPLTYIGYLSFIQLKFGNWRLIYRAMDVWRQNIPTFPIQVFYRYFKILLLYRPFDLIYLVAVLELFFIFYYIAMLIYSYGRIRLSYVIFFFISIIIPATTGTFAGMPRYGLHLYPLFLTTALLIATKPSRKIIYFAVSLILLTICLTLFTRGYFIA